MTKELYLLYLLTMKVFKSGSQCEKNLGVDLSTSVLGTWNNA